MNILMICYYYPPLLDVGSKRSVAFSENFKKHGWNPFVISVRNPDKLYCLLGNDVAPDGIVVDYTLAIFNLYFLLGKLNGLLAKLFALFNVTLRRNYLMDLFCIPDIFIGWIPLTLIKGVKHIKQHDIDAIYVSCSPFSSAIIGVLLKKMMNKQLIIDFRDPFSLNELSDIVETPVWRININQAIENWIIRCSDIFVVNTEEVKIAYLAQYPVSRGKIYAVTNGFDFNFLVKNDLPKFSKFTIIYAGLFYFFDKRNNIYTESFFEALSLLKSRNVISSENFQFLYFGDEGQRLCEIGKSYSVDDLMVCNFRKPYPEVLQNLKRSHLQLLRISKPMISTKLFEGIAQNIPFLATIPEGEVEEMIKKYSPASYIVTERSPEKIANAIQDSMICYQSKSVVVNKLEEFKHEYSRENLSLKLMGIVEKSFNKKKHAQSTQIV